jgi:hypothetical protein
MGRGVGGGAVIYLWCCRELLVRHTCSLLRTSASGRDTESSLAQSTTRKRSVAVGNSETYTSNRRGRSFSASLSSSAAAALPYRPPKHTGEYMGMWGMSWTVGGFGSRGRRKRQGTSNIFAGALDEPSSLPAHAACARCPPEYRRLASKTTTSEITRVINWPVLCMVDGALSFCHRARGVWFASRSDGSTASGRTLRLWVGNTTPCAGLGGCRCSYAVRMYWEYQHVTLIPLHAYLCAFYW